ncbi:hypothetical protein J1792_29325 [Streptomyces triculaminicus]|uniref:DNA-directed RNA polymerase specialized sigma24 family protein n=2 Tax=Streptomyces TaxID=1883 RepID=A0A939JT97_9ACTN|nr:MULTISPECIES: hypothetical protein [Streptomyces]MBO0656697.1 hypothetical protein [Streptomyces triculaminicus]QSY47859.1 hypothetical protein J3S04_21745 [Streptomyces griseocarneus]
MEQQATVPRPFAPAPVDVEQAEAALIEHYPRLVRLAYLVLPPALGRNRRVLTAHALVQRALPRNRSADSEPVLPAPREAGGSPGDAGYAYVRQRVLRAALDAGRPRGRWQLPRPGQLPPLLPQVWGLRLFPRSGGADELALDQALAALSGPARAAYVLRELELPDDRDVRRLLAAAGAEDPDAALAEAGRLRVPAGSRDVSLLESVEFDPCSLQARPTDLMRRRQHARAALAALAAAVVCGTLLGLPGDGWGSGSAAAPSYARNEAAQQALDPARLTRAAPDAWKRADRLGYAGWPARGDRTGDKDLLRRALAVWARPGRTVQVTATPGTPSGPAAGPPQLLYAGEVDSAVVVLFHDGLRAVRYAESRNGDTGSAALDFARTDAADGGSAAALVLGRTDGNVRYLTAPWVTTAAARDLLEPTAAPEPLHRDADGVTDPLPSPAASGDCRRWTALQLGGHLVTDLAELVPARLTSGAPAAPHDVTTAAERAGWAHTACHLATIRGQGVRAVNSWRFATQALPGAGGTAEWFCTRAETWRGAGSRVLAQFQVPGGRAGAPGTVVARAEDSPVCGGREPYVLAGVLWKSRAGTWYALAAGGGDVASVTATGGVRGSAPGPVLAVPARQGARTELTARLKDGRKIAALR